MLKWFKKKKENKLEQAKRWHEALLALGEKPDLETLERIALDRKIEESKFPFQALFTAEEFTQLVDYHYPEEEGDGSDYHIWVTGTFAFNTIETAVYAKQLLVYLNKIEASLDMIGTKETIVSASASVKEKWGKLCHKAEETRHELLRVSKCEDSLDWTYQLTFSKTALLPEEELLGLVDENIKEGKPVAQKLIYSKDGAYPVTSPALMDLNQFLNENELPDDVYTELQKTISEIETRLKEEREVDKEINIRLEAEIRTKTAKEYHQIS